MRSTIFSFLINKGWVASTFFYLSGLIVIPPLHDTNKCSMLFQGKTLEWFKEATNHHPKVDIIFKADTDTAINFTALCDVVTNFASEQEWRNSSIYIGFVK